MIRRLAALSIAFMAAGANSPSLADDGSGFLRSMVGTWTVQQRMWPGPGAPAVELPAAVAKRELIGGKYLEEHMQPAEEAPNQPSFHRDAWLNHNDVTMRYEYTSLDTRAAQVMTEVSEPSTSRKSPEELKLQGGVFTAPQWGAARNVPFRYRLTLGSVKDGRQTVRLHFSPLNVLPKKEFLAFEYVYSLRH